MKPLDRLKELLRKNQLDAFIISKCDMFFSEEVLPHQDRLKYITNFSGSSGFAVVLSKIKQKSAIFSDGRYKLQIEHEVNKKDFDFFNGGILAIVDFVISNNKNIKNIGIDSSLISIKDFELLSINLKNKNLNLIKINQNLVDNVWINKPKIPQNNIYNLPIKYSGKNSLSKISELLEEINNSNSQAYFLSQPDSLSWLLNVRDNQLKYTPVFRALAIIKNDGNIMIFTEEDCNTDCFDKQKYIELYRYQDLAKILKSFSNNIFSLDPTMTSMKIFDLLKKNNVQVTFVDCPVLKTKSIKNIIEQKNTKNIHLNDGLAFLKLWYWFESKRSDHILTEEDISNKLYYFRSKSETFKGNSFPTISAYGKNGAIVHYKFKEGKSSKILDENLLLIDSGGQYLNGTTDVTRTLIKGKPSDEMKNFYTYVLKGHLALSNLIFPMGIKGCDIDSIARMYLWKNQEDYAHGTGHGVGHFLNVHEGPISISRRNTSKFYPGMIISNEPGYYKKNKYGIRIENLELVKKINFKNKNSNFLQFETLTMVPYEKKLIKKSLLSPEEKKQINHYHKCVYSNLNKLLTIKEKEIKKFLIKKTSKL